MENTEDTVNNKLKSKSRKRYEIPKTATCNVCGKSSITLYWSTSPRGDYYVLGVKLMFYFWLTIFHNPPNSDDQEKEKKSIPTKQQISLKTPWKIEHFCVPILNILPLMVIGVTGIHCLKLATTPIFYIIIF